jgi:hypothetical protein
MPQITVCYTKLDPAATYVKSLNRKTAEKRFTTAYMPSFAKPALQHREVAAAPCIRVMMARHARSIIMILGVFAGTRLVLLFRPGEREWLRKNNGLYHRQVKMTIDT